VFGLEVTWSLIQQRQQEEEEKIALQELNCLQECSEDREEEEQQQGDEDCEPDSTVSEQLENGGEDSDQNAGVGAEDEMETGDSFDGRSPSRGSSSVVDQSHAMPLSKLKTPEPEPSDGINVEGGASSDDPAIDCDVMVPFQGMKGPTGNENIPPQLASSPSDEWACPACTYHNPNSARKCQVCAKAKPRQKKRPIVELSV
jgi:hypothetical protein